MSEQNPVFIPGPTNIPDRLLKRECTCRRAITARRTSSTPSPRCSRTPRPCSAPREGTVLMFPASGTGGWEAAITNTLSPGDAVLVARYGMFSHRWIDMCERHGLDVRVIVECEWGEGGAAPQRFEEILSADTEHEIKAVLRSPHNETATGVKSDIGAVRAAIDSPSPPRAAARRLRQLARLDAVPHGRVGRGHRRVRLPEGLHAAHGLWPSSPSARRRSKRASGARLPRTFFAFADMLGANASGGFPVHPAPAP